MSSTFNTTALSTTMMVGDDDDDGVYTRNTSSLRVREEGRGVKGLHNCCAYQDYCCCIIDDNTGQLRRHVPGTSDSIHLVRSDTAATPALSAATAFAVIVNYVGKLYIKSCCWKNLQHDDRQARVPYVYQACTGCCTTSCGIYVCTVYLGN